MGSSLTRHAIVAGPDADMFVSIHCCFSDRRFIPIPVYVTSSVAQYECSRVAHTARTRSIGERPQC